MKIKSCEPHEEATQRGSKSAREKERDMEEMKENKVRIKTLMVKVSDLENTNLALNQKIADFVQTIDNIKSSHRSEMNVKEEEMQRLLEQLNHQQKEYQKLQVCVGNEIFKKMIVFEKIGIFLYYIY